jgi:AcrR family transcriptional regulator
MRVSIVHRNSHAPKQLPSREATRRRILDGALKLFSQKGYLGATTKEIAREANISEMTLFRHFPTKEVLFESVLSTHSFLPALKEILPAIKGKPPEEALALIARKYLATLERRKDFIKILLSQSEFFPEKMHTIYHAFLSELFSTLAAYLREMQSEGFYGSLIRCSVPCVSCHVFHLLSDQGHSSVSGNGTEIDRYGHTRICRIFYQWNPREYTAMAR